MSIDARVETVIVNEDGSGELRLIDRPVRWVGDHPGCAGQRALFFAKAPEEVTALNGLDIWGGAGSILLGDKEIAKRVGYGPIAFVAREAFLTALSAYHAKREAPAPQAFVLVQDDDGHWFVCPADKQDEASRYFEAVADYWSPGSGYDGDAPTEPDWLTPVGGAPSLVKFTGWTIG